MKVKVIGMYGHDLNKAIEVYPLCEENLELIPDDALCGNYRIGLFDSDNHFLVRYYGRTDGNTKTLRSRIEDHLGDVTNRANRIYDSSYYFWFETANSDKEAYEQECRDFHSFGIHETNDFVDNDIHPDKPNGKSYLHCPVCNQ